MATNKPPGDNARKGAVRKRSQLKTKVVGESLLDETADMVKGYTPINK